jgi:hypothetical protein
MKKTVFSLIIFTALLAEALPWIATQGDHTGIPGERGKLFSSFIGGITSADKKV